MAEDKGQSAPPAERGKDDLPSIRLKAFRCPHCGTYTHQFWYDLHVHRLDAPPFIPGKENLTEFGELEEVARERAERLIEKHEAGNVFFGEDEESHSRLAARNLHLSKCLTCDEIAVWIHDRLAHPPRRSGPEPNEDLPDSILPDYQEARSILDLSPRGAAALLRLCVEKLCKHLNAAGKGIDAMIADLVKKGLSVRVQQSLDAVRVIGNEAVHAGKMDLNDRPETAAMLFGLVNLITEKMISEEKHVNEIYNLIPPSKREGIKNRDKGSKKE